MLLLLIDHLKVDDFLENFQDAFQIGYFGCIGGCKVPSSRELKLWSPGHNIHHNLHDTFLDKWVRGVLKNVEISHDNLRLHKLVIEFVFEDIAHYFKSVDKRKLKLLKIKIIFILLDIVCTDLKNLLLILSHIVNRSIILDVDSIIVDDINLLDLLVNFVGVDSVDVLSRLLRDVLLRLSEETVCCLVFVLFHGSVVGGVDIEWLRTSVEEPIDKLAVIFPSFDVH